MFCVLEVRSGQGKTTLTVFCVLELYQVKVQLRILCVCVLEVRLGQGKTTITVHL